MKTGKRDLGSVDSHRGATDQIAQLLGWAEPRPPLPDERKQRVREAVYSQWSGQMRARRRRRRVGVAACLAAVVVLAVMLAPVARERVSSYFAPTYEGPVGEVAMIDGLVWVAPRGASEQYPGRRLNVNEVIEAGARIETTAGARVALQLNDGRSVRVDHDTRLHLMDPLTLDLRKGALYVDTGPSESAADSVEIRTALGSVYDIGTQFEVRFSDEALRVRVREGLIHLDRSGEAIEAPAGVELSVDAAGELSRRSVEVYGPIWDWILEIAPPFALEGSTLPTFLAWVSRETGREIRFADEVHAQSASGVVVHGSVEGMRPDSALDAVLPTCDLMHRLDGEVWVLESQLQ